jgi:BlaI family transcriptional regulator, penicillinase repressor
MKATRTLSRREREMMDIVFRAGQATATEVMAAMADPPSYSAVRATLSVLERKGFLRHESDGTRHVFHPTLDRERVRRGALEHLLTTFFEGSASLLDRPARRLSPEELERIEQLIAEAREGEEP